MEGGQQVTERQSQRVPDWHRLRQARSLRRSRRPSKSESGSRQAMTVAIRDAVVRSAPEVVDASSRELPGSEPMRVLSILVVLSIRG